MSVWKCFVLPGVAATAVFLEPNSALIVDDLPVQQQSGCRLDELHLTIQAARPCLSALPHKTWGAFENGSLCLRTNVWVAGEADHQAPLLLLGLRGTGV